MKIHTFSLGQLQANCQIVEQGNDCIIIDPADDASFILEELQRRKLRLLALCATHGHFDHIMAAGEIQMSLGVPLYIFRQDLFLIKRLPETAEHFLGYKPAIIPPKNIKYLQEGMFHVSRFTLHVLHSPGHTPGSSCFYFKKDQTIFTGDTIFKDAVGRFDHAYSSRSELKKSLQNILSLPPKTTIYPGHGEKTAVEAERKTLQLIVV